MCFSFLPDLSSWKKVEATELFSKIKPELSEKLCVFVCPGRGVGGEKGRRKVEEARKRMRPKGRGCTGERKEVSWRKESR